MKYFLVFTSLNLASLTFFSRLVNPLDHLFCERLLSTYSVPSSMIGASITRVNKIDMVLALMELTGRGVSTVMWQHIAGQPEPLKGNWKRFLEGSDIEAYA